MLQKRTDLALEAHELWRGTAKNRELPGLDAQEHDAFGYPVTVTRITNEAAAESLGKPMGTYITLDLRSYWNHAEDALERAASAVSAEMRKLLKNARTALVVCLGNSAMTPDAIGPQTAEHVLATRHLLSEPVFAQLNAVSVLAPGVLGRTGMEAAETVRGAVYTVKPDVLIAVDALAARSLERLCTTVQLTDTGIIPGSGVGNSRKALSRETLGVPVIALGVPTVVDAATLTLDVLEEAGVCAPDAALLRGHERVMVTTRDIDAQLCELARVIGYGINLALQPLDFSSLAALLG